MGVGEVDPPVDYLDLPVFNEVGRWGSFFFCSSPTNSSEILKLPNSVMLKAPAVESRLGTSRKIQIGSNWMVRVLSSSPSCSQNTTNAFEHCLFLLNFWNPSVKLWKHKRVRCSSTTSPQKKQSMTERCDLQPGTSDPSKLKVLAVEQGGKLLSLGHGRATKAVCPSNWATRQGSHRSATHWHACHSQPRTHNDGIHRVGPTSTAFNGLASSNSTWQWKSPCLKINHLYLWWIFMLCCYSDHVSLVHWGKVNTPIVRGPSIGCYTALHLPLAISEGYKSHRHNEGWFMCIYIYNTYIQVCHHYICAYVYVMYVYIYSLAK